MTKPNLLRTGTINPVTFHRYERYLPTAFDESLSILEKMNKIIYYMNEIGELTNDMLEQWNKVYDWVMNEGLAEEVSAKLEVWMSEGVIGELVEDTLDQFTVEIRQMVQAFIDEYQTQIDSLVQADYRLDFERARNIYLFDLQLAFETINQALVIDETNNQIFATQAYNLEGDSLQSFYITRMTLGGRYLDHMLVRYGGHGTSIGLEVVNGTPRIYTNIIQPDATETETACEHLVSFNYIPNGEVKWGSSSITIHQEWPVGYNVYQTPFSDQKNGLLALRITDTSSGSNDSRVEVKRLSDVKAGIHDQLVYSYEFTNEMNASILQGMALDDSILYLTFGSNANNFVLFQIDMTTGEILQRKTGYDLDMDSSKGNYEADISEPEGLHLYTDPRTKQVTLFHVLVSDTAGRRRNRLYAISSNSGINIFQGFANANALQFPLVSNTGRGKAIPSDITALSQLREPGEFYISTVQSSNLTDHPDPGVAGWHLTNSAQDTAGGVIQTLERASAIYYQCYKRRVNKSNVSEWTGLKHLVTEFQNGFDNYYEDDAQPLGYAIDGNTLYLNGIITNETGGTTGTITTLPNGFRPRCRVVVPIFTSQGLAELMVNSSGEVIIASYFGGTPADTTFIHLNASIYML